MSDIVSAIVEITLLDTKPGIRRRVSAPYSLLLSRFHLVLQVAMGWQQREAHVFLADDLIAGNPQEMDLWDLEDESQLTLGELLPWVGAEAVYLYDFEDEWRHRLQLIDLGHGNDAIMILSGAGYCPREGSEDAQSFRRRKSGTSARSKKTSAANRKQAARTSDRIDLPTINQELAHLSRLWKPKRKRTNSCRALLLVDSQSIRAGYLRGLHEIRQRILAIEDDLTRHEDEDLPEFRRFLSATFATQFSLLRELHQEIDWLSARLALVQKLMLHGIRPVGRAYSRALRIEAGKEPYPDFQPEAEPPPNSEEDADAQFTEEVVRDFISNVGDQFLSHEEMESLTQDVLSAQAGAHQNAKAECKSLYRKIVSLLHPDRAGEMTKETKELWLRAQSAYADADVLSLKSILDRCGSGNDVRYLSCSEIIDVTAEAAMQLEAMDLLRERVAKEPSWNFSRLTEKKRKSRLRSVTKELKEEKADLEIQLNELRRECEHLNQQAERWELKHATAGNQPELF